jgi:hypothetical protein
MTESLRMIDNPQLTAELFAKLEAALPLPAIVTPYLACVFLKQSPEASIPRACKVVWITNMGDEGGIVCKLSADGNDDTEQVLITSLTYLDFDRWHPLARDIEAYRKRRIKKLRRQNGCG